MSLGRQQEEGEQARIRAFIETPRSRRHPDMLVPDEPEGEAE
jgi:hypothetical protein